MKKNKLKSNNIFVRSKAVTGSIIIAIIISSAVIGTDLIFSENEGVKNFNDETFIVCSNGNRLEPIWNNIQVAIDSLDGETSKRVTVPSGDYIVTCTLNVTSDLYLDMKNVNVTGDFTKLSGHIIKSAYVYKQL